MTNENRENNTQAKANKAVRNHNVELGDFTTTWRVVPISCLAMLIGVLCAFVALARHLEEEVRRERPLALKFFLPGKKADLTVK